MFLKAIFGFYYIEKGFLQPIGNVMIQKNKYKSLCNSSRPTKITNRYMEKYSKSAILKRE
ncbi:hypothetical protein CON65_20720 [Bacillus pseudomycoides]|uniref:Uncharacterized protein n=1 Tax=Bacillus pseudomycoides TaxID=64104 RepID=A0AA91V9B3_9BACI|nr:hypothetical protein COO03_01080 [Bacillus sp. AFS098217]PED80804.1 hypothetical protein CON65_20720 [Bacillus pseudomycoides]PEU09318.1 hypothetical protein CN524_18490 [Bacillus sp. AFS019443]PEU16847.1 hypothetical protein CN525_15470 [Bacillus sp. AFS014408]PFW62802.1 hypothetical protein COL20_11455 [Bacillus sp. AFS075034]